VPKTIRRRRFVDMRYVITKTVPWSSNPPASTAIGVSVLRGMLSAPSKLGLAMAVPSSQIDSWLSDLDAAPAHDAEVRNQWLRETGSKLPSGPSALGTLNLVLYLIVRWKRPRVVVETGVEYGFSSSFILRGLEDNGLGELWSIDLPTTDDLGRLNADGRLDPAHVEAAGAVGRAIPKRLRGRWHLVIGPSDPCLATVIAEKPSVDMFFHDSDHSTRNMRWEFETVWPSIRPGGLLVADDIDWNNAFETFAGRVGSRPFRWWGARGARGFLVKEASTEAPTPTR
jgi:predicted O-methyltransferase YrrM